MSKQTRSYVSENINTLGHGYVVVSRKNGRGRIESGVFLVDIYCRGVKGAFLNICELEEEFLNDFLPKVYPDAVPEAKAGAWGRKLVEGAVAYANKLGFAPCADYKMAARVFGGINAAECTETFVYGKDGKPFFIQGLNDTPFDVRRMLAQLKARCGENNFHYLVEDSDPEEL
jgi:hypothetical protein